MKFAGMVLKTMAVDGTEDHGGRCTGRRAAYLTGEMMEELGFPQGTSMILTAIVSGGVTYTAGRYFFKDATGKVIAECTQDELEKVVKGEMDNVIPDISAVKGSAVDKLMEEGSDILNEGVFTRYMPDGIQVTDFSRLPGNEGIEISRRLSVDEMTYLTQEYGVEFAQIYRRGTGANGGGGKYIIYSGDVSSVQIPVAKDVMLINHTHPSGTAFPSKADMKLISLLEQIGSPQRTSEIIPIGKLETVKFGAYGIK